MIQFQGITFSQDLEQQADAHIRKKQEYIDKECIRLMQPYTPMKTGKKIDISASATVPGQGVIEYRSSIARRNYYENKGTGSEGLQARSGAKGLRGAKWFERMKADHKAEILKGAQKIK